MTDLHASATMPPPGEGWRMPAEWEPHACTWLAFPADGDHWGERLAGVRADVAALARAISGFEPVRLLARPEDAAAAAALAGPAVEIVPLALDDLWIRDTGPSFLTSRDGALAASVWRFNTWGGKFDGYRQDRTLAGRLCAATGTRAFPAPLVTEGGALHVDGAGTLLVTESSVLNDNRNPGLDRREAERIFRAWLGVERVVWLPGCRTETITDGHIDGFACFARPGVVLAELPASEAAGDWREMQENLRALRLARDAQGRDLEIGLLTRPAEVPSERATFCDCYVNFYVANGGVVMPGFGDPAADGRARDLVQAAFPDRRVLQLDVGRLAEGGGGIHCSTQQQPLVAT